MEDLRQCGLYEQRTDTGSEPWEPVDLSGTCCQDPEPLWPIVFADDADLAGNAGKGNDSSCGICV